jgi:hypothetical protein
MRFQDIIRNRSSNSFWTNWLVRADCKAAAETLGFLSSCFSELPANKRGRLEKRIVKCDEHEIEAIYSELVAYELLKRLRLDPEWSPKIQSNNPDLAFRSNCQDFIADVLVIRSLSKTIEPHGKVIASWDSPTNPSESRSKKFADHISNKATKYRGLGLPLVVFVFRGDHHLVNLEKIESALYGMTIEEIMNGADFPGDLGETGIHPGILLPRNGEELPHQNLAALIYCDWFDTLNRADEGKRLHCVVLHCWAAKIPLPYEVFGDFGQVTWRKRNQKQIEPQIIGDMSTVVKFSEDGYLEKKEYSSLKPW